MKIQNFYLYTILLISCLQENDCKPKIYPVIRNLRWIFHSNPGFYLDRIFYTRKLGLIFMNDDFDVIIWKQFSNKKTFPKQENDLEAWQSSKDLKKPKKILRKLKTNIRRKWSNWNKNMTKFKLKSLILNKFE